MFENLAKLTGIGASLAFLLTLVHEAIFFFIIGVDLRLLPYQVGDIVAISALVLPQILGFLFASMLFAIAVFGDRPSVLGIGLVFLMSSLYLWGYWGKVSLLILMPAFALVFSAFRPVPLSVYVKRLSDNFLQIGLLVVLWVVLRSMADASSALYANGFVHIQSDLDPNGVHIIRVIGKGLIVRDSGGQFSFVQGENFETFPLTRNPFEWKS